MTHRQVALSRGMFATVDDEDYDRVMEYKWHVAQFPTSATYYAVTDLCRDGERKVIRLHRFILGLTDPEEEVDHINQNGLDNRKENLRITDKRTQALNSKLFSTNTSGFRGVCKSRNRKRWRAYHCHNDKRIHIGIFDTLEEASNAREEFVQSLA